MCQETRKKKVHTERSQSIVTNPEMTEQDEDVKTATPLLCSRTKEKHDYNRQMEDIFFFNKKELLKIQNIIYETKISLYIINSTLEHREVSVKI